jgi:flagellar biosynthetic protein FliQ
MDETAVIHFAKVALGTGFLVTLPALIVVTIVGLGISIIQAIVQVQEQSVSFVLKLVSTALTLALAGPWMMSKLTDLIVTNLENLASFIQ